MADTTAAPLPRGSYCTEALLRSSPRWAHPRSGACHQGRGTARRRLRRINPFVVLGDNLLVEDAYLFHHQQPHVLDDVACQLLLGDVLAFYVEPEVLALQATAVGEVHLEIELHPSVRGVFFHRPPQSSQTSYDIHSTSRRGIPRTSHVRSSRNFAEFG